ncbi:three-finger toxin MALT0070C-like isoform X4 [Xyrauchen texanus]|uniref:three-finger toxin MALT0070C-like isoform X2 n=1 Tax=Xyrauchen texanus TaxID=154827 RepID=UPI002241F729|nr:three-finger toxin MALT0070C-like isoform X2 [Xyrauchen texanus]XP_051959777.1 three-finger toxin MALT0070C-like isoform X3 [Xyrauchen texanus]XP_051959778.1 three-finger toxin MALT0070C-like isoform X4 [Xyrauchen texanus]
MDLQISIVLLSILLTGGHSLKCYKCELDDTGICNRTIVTCPSGNDKCASITAEVSNGNSKVTLTQQSCLNPCVAGTVQSIAGVTVVTKCCETDLCNGSDGIYKGSFQLLLLPLFFYIFFN